MAEPVSSIRNLGPAMDAARVARRLGAEEAILIYRRDREHMPAHAFEADEAGRLLQVADVAAARKRWGPNVVIERATLGDVMVFMSRGERDVDAG